MEICRERLDFTCRPARRRAPASIARVQRASWPPLFWSCSDQLLILSTESSPPGHFGRWHRSARNLAAPHSMMADFATWLRASSGKPSGRRAPIRFITPGQSANSLHYFVREERFERIRTSLRTCTLPQRRARSRDRNNGRFFSTVSLWAAGSSSSRHG